MWILEALKNQSESWKSPGNLFLNKGTNPVKRNNYLTIRLWARDFYEVIVDEAEGRINYRLVEIESE